MAEYDQRRRTWRDRESSIFSDDDDPSRRARGDDRGFIERAGDEVRAWFGDEEAEQRRERDGGRDSGPTQRDNVRRDNGWTRGPTDSHASAGRGFQGGSQYDRNYLAWRDRQIAQFDRDYEEYCRERGEDFEQGFQTWRSSRLTDGGTGRSGSAMFGVGSGADQTDAADTGAEASAMTASTGSSGGTNARQEKE